MPQFLDKLDKTQNYAIIFIARVLGIPGSFLGGKLVQTNLGRKYTTILGFVLGGICNFLFYFVEDVIYVSK
jgi:MFS-type transporter involved in bile tolerance (Atg22 family)